MSERKDHYEEDYYGLRKKPDINTIKKNIDKRAQEMYGNRNRQNSGNTAPENRKRVPQRETQRQNGAKSEQQGDKKLQPVCSAQQQDENGAGRKSAGTASDETAGQGKRP